MRIIMRNKNQNITIDLYDEYDKKTKITSMARTTGYTCTAGANLLIHDMFNNSGVFPPELIGKDVKSYKFILDYLQKRNINLITTTN